MHFHKKSIKIIAITFIVLLLSGSIVDLLARPGGGSSFRGGSRSYSSSRSSSSGGSYSSGGSLPVSGENVGFAFAVILIFVVVNGVKVYLKQSQEHSIISTPPKNTQNTLRSSKGDMLKKMKKSDENFSNILFIEFTTALYHKFHTFKGKPAFTTIAPFFSERLKNKQKNGSLSIGNVSEIVIGNIEIVSIELNRNIYDYLTVNIQANYTTTKNGNSQRRVTDEKWLLKRKKGVKSAAPELMRTLTCPSCGATANFSDSGHCAHCQTFIQGGEHQWMVESTTEKIETFSSHGLGHYEQETGTDYPTIVHDNLRNNIHNYLVDNNIPAWNDYFDQLKNVIVKPIFLKIYSAWSENKWNEARHLISDRLYDSYKFWITNYKQENLVNKLNDIEIGRIDLAHIDTDKYYETITVRIFASCYDYVENSRTGKLIGGSKRHKRVFSEYWSFVRRKGVQKDESKFDLNKCPNCGAPADKMGQAAECEYCGTKISFGDFSWVLAMIVQDEVYTV